mmetsp:Transcript_43028/g.96617  ORF Transcript_43028/g.96617 Transcript_43028/m.96617 type:complete len:179 (-) Transcript_43028:372-908(-)
MGCKDSKAAMIREEALQLEVGRCQEDLAAWATAATDISTAVTMRVVDPKLSKGCLAVSGCSCTAKMEKYEGFAARQKLLESVSLRNGRLEVRTKQDKGPWEDLYRQSKDLESSLRAKHEEQSFGDVGQRILLNCCETCVQEKQWQKQQKIKKQVRSSEDRAQKTGMAGLPTTSWMSHL